VDSSSQGPRRQRGWAKTTNLKEKEIYLRIEEENQKKETILE
jgi:hypothetical protein